MFTGIIERSIPLRSVATIPAGKRLAISNIWHDVKAGESVAVNGACLTVADLSDQLIAFDVIGETLSKTNLGFLAAGDEVHVERSLRLGDRLDGHFVQGHVDATARILNRNDDPLDWRLRIELPPLLRDFLIPQGSVCVEGVSLTIAFLDEEFFEVALIPTTLEITRLGQKPVGWPLNIECDMMAKTAAGVIRRMESRVITINSLMPQEVGQ